MPIKNRNFYAYQIDLHYLGGERGDYDSIMWETNIVEEIFTHIYSLEVQNRTLRFHDAWLMYLDHFTVERNYLFGRFAYAEYGTAGDLVHADNLRVRPNPKHLREGETIYVYFAIRKSDGLLLLQSHVRINRPRFEEYVENFGERLIREHNLTFIQICTLLDSSFFDNINALTTVNRISIEVTTKQPAADENPAVLALQDEAEMTQATTVKLDFLAKYQRSGLKGAVPFVRRYKDKPGVSKIVVKGKLAGAEKIIRMDESQEKYGRKLEVDGSGQPTIESAEIVLSEILSSREGLLRRGEDETS